MADQANSATPPSRANAPMYADSDAKATELKTLVENGYNTIAEKYNTWSSPRPTTTRMAYIDKLLGLLLPSDQPSPSSKPKLLELGCGAGIPCAKKFVDAGLDYTGADISDGLLDLARKQVPGATFVHSDMMALDFAPGSLDAVVAFYSLFHLPAEEQGLMITKIHGWLKAGGYLLFNTGGRAETRQVDNWMGAPMFSTHLGYEGNRKMMQESGKGFKIIDDEEALEQVARLETFPKEPFHWIFAQKE
ncbi:S-adenosyl-L-methionine-dependent methyltransferase [Coniophora puteana RWD-64-598 SS2]|uniref:S-adenosyl-L-methionine-dependent methyltransferase n=1 Tax=Coniophora puteana (strain RWD-64-598) TaxID=741705 RepID=A0A5M3MW67_CONPW|nr:S-adenosyl-L-methionine-dependent methyltransferase [Coniophora puteana RWD-64-598 SS2]EIW83399.1 S-adenosyl-L-methionine-dependent methyltransferase [Coniophora puteana RWD-64-598 SS2]